MNYDPLATLYALQYAHYRDDLAHYARLADNLNAQTILELGAGQGRLALHLAKRGHQVTALEPSNAMRERGAQHAKDAGLDITWHNAKMQRFEIGQRFPLVIAAFNTLMHLYSLEEQDQCLRNVRDHLLPGGVFAFDLYRPLFGTPGVLRHEGETFKHTDGSRSDVLLHQRIDELAQIVLTTYFVDTIAPDATLRREVLELKQRYYQRHELERWFRAHGFRLDLSGDFENSRLHDGSAFFVGVARMLD